MTNILSGNTTVTGNLSVAGSWDGLGRSDMDLEAGNEFHVPLESLRVHDAYQTVLPGTSATDDLGLYGGTFGTNSPAVRTYDAKTVGATTLYARGQFQLPANYVTQKSATFRLHCQMVGAVADTSCTVDVEAYLSDEEGGIGSDLVTTAAASINSLTGADYDFALDTATLLPGGILDFRIAIAVNDAAGGASVQAEVGSIKLVLDTQG